MLYIWYRCSSAVEQLLYAKIQRFDLCLHLSRDNVWWNWKGTSILNSEEPYLVVVTTGIYVDSYNLDLCLYWNLFFGRINWSPSINRIWNRISNLCSTDWHPFFNFLCLSVCFRTPHFDNVQYARILLWMILYDAADKWSCFTLQFR